MCSRSRGRSQTGAELAEYKRLARLGTFVLCMNMLPTNDLLMSRLQYAVVSKESLPILTILSAVSCLLACLLFGACFNRMPSRRLFCMATSVWVAIACASLPFVLVAGSASPEQGLFSEAGTLALTATVLGGVSTVFTVLPMDSLITKVSGNLDGSRSVIAYAVLLSLVSFGGTIQGLVLSPVYDALDLTGTDWSAAPYWISGTAVLRLLVFPLLLLIPPSVTGLGVGGDGLLVADGEDC